MTDPPPSAPPPGTPFPWLRVTGIVALLLLAGLLLFQGMHVLENMIGTLNSIRGTREITPLIIVALIIYSLLIAIPFMPGIEVGMALLMLLGSVIAPFVYLATVCGLLLAFGVGSHVPLSVLHRAFRALRMTRACDMITTIATTSPERRLAQQRATFPPWLAKLTVDYRYVTIGALLNLPGTFAIGGGGGILMLAGLSRLFTFPGILLTVLIATLPVPLTVWLTGTWFLAR